MRESLTHSPSAEAFDRGPAKYFHGREEILAKFGDTLWRSEQKKSGTTFLIQGAPGAGKTALLHKCEEVARDREWEIAEIPSSALWDPSELQQSIDLRRTLEAQSGSASINLFGIGGAEVNAKRSPQTIKTYSGGVKNHYYSHWMRHRRWA